MTKPLHYFRTVNFTADKKQKLTLLIASIAIASATTYFFLYTSSNTNFNTAYIEQEQQGYKVTVEGKRLYMLHDPVSLFFKKTYEDSAQFIIPRREGVISGQELPNKKGYYKSVGDIIITDKKLTINLYTENYDEKTLDPNTWNGNYKLVWRQK